MEPRLPKPPPSSLLKRFRQWSAPARLGLGVLALALVAVVLWFTTPDCADGGCLVLGQPVGRARAFRPKNA